MYPRWPQTFWAARPSRPFGLFWLWDHLGNISLGNLDFIAFRSFKFFRTFITRVLTRRLTNLMMTDLGSWGGLASSLSPSAWCCCCSRSCSTAARLRGKRWATSISCSCRGGCSLSPVLTSDSILSSTGPSPDSGRPCILIEPLLPHCSMSSSFASKVPTCLQSLFIMASFFFKITFLGLYD